MLPLTFFHRASPKLKQTYLDDADIQQKINFNKPIMLLTHGWLERYDISWIQKTAQDAIYQLDINVCVVGWGHLARYNYYQSARKHTMLVSGYMSQFINFLNLDGMPLEKVTLVGHSLGGQICGQVGYNFEGQLGAIYGLDPAGPLFTFPVDVGLRYRLDKSDAKYVQTIITSRYTLGVGKGEGHQNFYPNNGDAPQPNCVIPLTSDAEMADQIVCSHLHSTSLFRLSLDPALVFKARQCLNWAFYRLGLCNDKSADVLGVHSRKLHGDFYLRTSHDAPYVYSRNP